MYNISKNLKDLRVKNNLTQTEIAKKLNISQRTYSFYETGKTEPNISILNAIADFYRVPIDILTGRYIDSSRFNTLRGLYKEIDRLHERYENEDDEVTLEIKLEVLQDIQNWYTDEMHDFL
jgi:transcriptional regulator with XRE-family HTH domain